MTDSIIASPPGVLDQVKDQMRNNAHRAKSLLNTRVERNYFDPAKPDDRLAYLVFTKTGRWIKQFYFEAPDLSVIGMIQRKLIEHALRGEQKRAVKVIEQLSKREVITHESVVKAAEAEIAGRLNPTKAN